MPTPALTKHHGRTAVVSNVHDANHGTVSFSLGSPWELVPPPVPGEGSVVVGWNVDTGSFSVLCGEAEDWLRNITGLGAVADEVGDGEPSFDDLDVDLDADFVAPRRVRGVVKVKIVRRNGRIPPRTVPSQYFEEDFGEAGIG